MQVVERIGVLSVGKISAVIGVVFGVIAGAIVAAFGEATGGPILGGVHWLVDLVGLTVIYVVGGFVGGVLFAVLYNIAAKLVGGVRLELADA